MSIGKMKVVDSAIIAKVIYVLILQNVPGGTDITSGKICWSELLLN